MHDLFMNHYTVLKDFATPVLTIIGFGITVTFGIAGFRTFGKWKREQIEERRIETSIEALSLAYESKYVFEFIRSSMVSDYEWADMPKVEGEDEGKRQQKGSIYAVLRRMRLNKDFFERAYKLQPKCMAMFGNEAEVVFNMMHRARGDIEVSCASLIWRVQHYEPGERDQNDAFYAQCRRDVWEMHDEDKDKVGAKLNEFRDKMEKLFRPVVDRKFRANSR
jgi:hypothetical protein